MPEGIWDSGGKGEFKPALSFGGKEMSIYLNRKGEFDEFAHHSAHFS